MVVRTPLTNFMDRSTLSSYLSTQILKTALTLKVDWSHRILRGSVAYTLKGIKSQQLTLDTSHLEILSAEFENEPLKWELRQPYEPLGRALDVQLPQDAREGILKLAFATTQGCTALQWLGPEQTASKRAPYLFSQCEALHARSLFPCFDTPAVKSPFEIVIESQWPAVATGVEQQSPAKNTYLFNQNIPIPSYLLAVASGDLQSAAIGPRSRVWCEPPQLAACKYEFEADTEKFIQAAEEITFPYEWHTYDILVLPPSFPFGGMENPNITFATPTLISGDRQLVNVIAHELAHSWSGNLVTNKTWEHFWLNEGWTVYLERRILGALYGESFRQFSMLIGWKDLEDAIEEMPEEFQTLVWDLNDGKIDPDDAFSTVPYEKGSTFLFYLETLLGSEEWDKFIKFYFSKWAKKSLDTDDFKSTLLEFFGTDKLKDIDWHVWLHTPGLPPKPDFDASLARPCHELAAKWAVAAETGDANWAHIGDISGFTSLQLVVLLDEICNLVLKTRPEFLHVAVEKLGAVYSVAENGNCEVKDRWFRLAVTAGIETQKLRLAEWLGTLGRMKFVRPGYRLLSSVDRELAVQTFKKNKDFYHPICRQLLEKTDLKLASF